MDMIYIYIIYSMMYIVCIVLLTGTLLDLYNERLSQMRAPLAARRKPAGVQNRPPSVRYVFEHKM